jgi:hypothetical protein
LLQFDANFPIPDDEAAALSDDVTARYADLMDASTDYVAVVVHDDVHLAIGRADGGRQMFLSADIRRGRPQERRRAFAVAVMDDLRERFDVPRPNLKVSFTEHAGGDLMGYDRVGDEWAPDGEDG